MLEGTLASLAADAVPGGEWEVVVVDNDPGGEAGAVVAGFEERLPVRCVDEARTGLSHARNRAVRDVEADYLIWLDDDVLVRPGWFTAYETGFREWPDAAVFGGPIHPRFEGSPPGWLLKVADQVGHAYAARDLGPTPIALGSDPAGLPFGANFAGRAEEQRRHPFPPDRGRRGDTVRPGGEEIAVLRAMFEDGATGRWLPDAAVDHRIEADRQTTDYLREYARADALHDIVAGWADPPAGRLAVPRAVAAALLAESRYRIARFVAPPAVWVAHLQRAGHARGRLAAARAAGHREVASE